MTSETPTALRFNTGKLRLSLVPASTNRYIAAGLTYGAEKYTVLDEQGNVVTSGVDNWRKGFATRQLLDSLERHLIEIKEGRDIDEESGLPHLCLMGCNLAFLIEQFDKGFGTDDRPKLAPGRLLSFRLPAHPIHSKVSSGAGAAKRNSGKSGLRGVVRKGRRRS